jgi:hypothetical protein
MVKGALRPPAACGTMAGSISLWMGNAAAGITQMCGPDFHKRRNAKHAAAPFGV